jgi:hypothetical protein
VVPPTTGDHAKKANIPIFCFGFWIVFMVHAQELLRAHAIPKVESLEGKAWEAESGLRT